MAIDPYKIMSENTAETILDETVEHLRTSEPVAEDGKVTYPGERTFKTRKENMEKGIPVDDGVWNEVLGL